MPPIITSHYAGCRIEAGSYFSDAGQVQPRVLAFEAETQHRAIKRIAFGRGKSGDMRGRWMVQHESKVCEGLQAWSGNDEKPPLF